MHIPGICLSGLAPTLIKNPRGPWGPFSVLNICISAKANSFKHLDISSSRQDPRSLIWSFCFFLHLFLNIKHPFVCPAVAARSHVKCKQLRMREVGSKGLSFPDNYHCLGPTIANFRQASTIILNGISLTASSSPTSVRAARNCHNKNANKKWQKIL